MAVEHGADDAAAMSASTTTGAADVKVETAAIPSFLELMPYLSSLQSMSLSTAHSLQQTIEYAEFAVALVRLQAAHEQIVHATSSIEEDVSIVPVTHPAKPLVTSLTNTATAADDCDMTSGPIRRTVPLAAIPDDEQPEDIIAASNPIKAGSLRRVVSLSDTTASAEECGLNFWHSASDDVLFRLLAFMECRDLVQFSMTCTRLNHLVVDWAAQQVQRDDAGATVVVEGRRRSLRPYSIGSLLQYVRVQEQRNGIAPESPLTIPIPTLLLPQRIQVSHCGDQDYNGIYFCTGLNGNGYVFSKPYGNNWYPVLLPSASTNIATATMERPPRRQVMIPSWLEDDDPRGSRPQAVLVGNDAALSSSTPRRLRCCISKCFSNETILWYMSKEMIGGDGDDGTSSTTLNQGRQHQQHSGGDAAATARSRSTSSSAATSRVQGDAAARADVRRFGVEVHEEFFFWAKLMSLDEAPLDKLQYPSLSPIPPSQRRDYRGARDGWQCLYPERNVRPPLVTLMD